jgi:hypothetical protein
MASTINRGGRRYCPVCKQIVETRVLPGGYRQVPMGDILLKRRVVICGTDLNGSNGCGCKWVTLEKMDEILELGNTSSTSESNDQGQEER